MTNNERDKRIRRSGGRAARRMARGNSQQEIQAYITRKIPPIDVLHNEAAELIEANADLVLNEIHYSMVPMYFVHIFLLRNS